MQDCKVRVRHRGRRARHAVATKEAQKDAPDANVTSNIDISSTLWIGTDLVISSEIPFKTALNLIRF